MDTSGIYFLKKSTNHHQQQPKNKQKNPNNSKQPDTNKKQTKTKGKKTQKTNPNLQTVEVWNAFTKGYVSTNTKEGNKNPIILIQYFLYFFGLNCTFPWLYYNNNLWEATIPKIIA